MDCSAIYTSCEHAGADPTLLAIDTLGEIGPDAEDALEVLRSKLDEAEIGKAAETAIAKIQGSD